MFNKSLGFTKILLSCLVSVALPCQGQEVCGDDLALSSIDKFVALQLALAPLIAAAPDRSRHSTPAGSISKGTEFDLDLIKSTLLHESARSCESQSPKGQLGLKISSMPNSVSCSKVRHDFAIYLGHITAFRFFYDRSQEEVQAWKDDCETEYVDNVEQCGERIEDLRAQRYAEILEFEEDVNHLIPVDWWKDHTETFTWTIKSSKISEQTTYELEVPAIPFADSSDEPMYRVRLLKVSQGEAVVELQTNLFVGCLLPQRANFEIDGQQITFRPFLGPY